MSGTAMKRPSKPAARLLALGALVLVGILQFLSVEDDAADFDYEFLYPTSSAGRRTLRASDDDAPTAPSSPRHHPSRRLCLASVADGAVSSAAVADAHGEFSLALPRGYKATAAVECTVTDPTTGEATVEGREEREFVGEEEDAGGCDDRLSFRPGYFDHSTGAWHDRCSAFVSETRDEGALPRGDGALAPDRCPLTARAAAENKDLWIHLVGDSVTRGLVANGLSQAGVAMGRRDVRHWYTGRGQGKNQPDVLLRGIDVDEKNGRKVWISYQFDYMHDSAAMDHPVARTWGEFLERRSTAAAHPQSVAPLRLGSPTAVPGADPDFAPDRVPDVVYFSPGYHASKATAEEYGAGMERVLEEWRRKMDDVGASMPPMHIALNMMPATWMIPDRYAADRPHRTMLNEHRKNLAIVEASAKFDFVEGVLDFHTVELPFHGTAGEATAHQDAVHLLPNHAVTRVTGDMVLWAICHTRSGERSELDGKKVWDGKAVSLETSGRRGR